MSELVLPMIGLAIAFGGGDALRLAAGRFETSLAGGEAGTLASDIRKWVVASVLLAFVLVVEGESLASVGIRPPAPLPVLDGALPAPLALVGWIVLGLGLTFALGMAAYALCRRLGRGIPEEFIAAQRERSVAARLFTALTAGVTESLLYQGYPIERLTTLSGSVVAAAALSFLVFTAAHYLGDTFSLPETVYIGVPAFSMTLLYVLSGSLLVVVAVHAGVDALSLLSDPPADQSASNSSRSSP